jgi:hypothetical protein
MRIALPALSVLFAAICVWLGVRIFNRRERWTKWLAATLAVPLLYIGSFGPWCWVMCRCEAIDEPNLCCWIYYPILRAWFDSGEVIDDSIDWYANLFAGPITSLGLRVAPAQVVATGEMTVWFVPRDAHGWRVTQYKRLCCRRRS